MFESELSHVATSDDLIELEHGIITRLDVFPGSNISYYQLIIKSYSINIIHNATRTLEFIVTRIKGLNYYQNILLISFLATQTLMVSLLCFICKNRHYIGASK